MIRTSGFTSSSGESDTVVDQGRHGSEGRPSLQKGLRLFAALLGFFCWLCSGLAAADVDYPVLFFRGPNGPTRNINLDQQGFYQQVPTRLIVRHPDGTETQLVEGVDYCPDRFRLDENGKPYRICVSMRHADGRDLFWHYPKTGETTRITNWETGWSPLRAVAKYTPHPRPDRSKGEHNDWVRQGRGYFGHGAWAAGPCVTPDCIVFGANWNYLQTYGANPHPIFQMFRCDLDGKNVEQINYANIVGGTLHGKLMTSGKILYWTGQNQGVRRQSQWGGFTINPDGTNIEPFVSATYDERSIGFHHGAELSDGTVPALKYYDSRIGGTVYGFKPYVPDTFNGPGTPFVSILPQDGVRIRNGYSRGATINAGVLSGHPK